MRNLLLTETVRIIIMNDAADAKGHGVMVTRGSPKPLLRVRILLPLPRENLHILWRFFRRQNAIKDSNRAVRTADGFSAEKSKPSASAWRKPAQFVGVFVYPFSASKTEFHNMINAPYDCHKSR